MRRVKLAEQEARLDLLRNRSKTHNVTETTTSSEVTSKEHVNFFNEVEEGKYVSQHENADHAKEKKEEQEKYEKEIGYLTYLGQDTNEINGKRNWYDTMPNRSRHDELDEDGRKIEVNLKSKLLQDPLAIMHRYLGNDRSEKLSKEKDVKTEVKTIPKYESVIADISGDHRHHKKSKKRKSKKHKKEKKSKKSKRKSSSDYSSSSDDEVRRNLKRQKLEMLRAERLKREKLERERAEKLLAKLRGEPEIVEKPPEVLQIRQKYNSQFNPDLARQNIE